MGKAKYYNWIDSVKIIGLYLMILGHGNLVSNEIRLHIYNFHMPLFFILSGMLYYSRKGIDCDRNIKESLLKCVKSLLIPYFMINIVCLFYYIVSGLIFDGGGNFNVDFFVSRIGAVLIGLGYNSGYWIPICPPSWFLYVLFLCKIFLIIIDVENLKSVYLVFIIFGSFSFSILKNYYEFDFLFPIDSVMLALPFVLLGFKYRSYLLLERKLKNKLLLILVSLIIFLLLGNINTFNGRVDLDLAFYGESLILFYIVAFAGSLFLIEFCKLIKYKFRLISYLVSGSTLIVGFNLIFVYYAGKIFNIPIINYLNHNLVGFCVAFIILILFYPMILFAKSYLPSILGYRK